MKNTIAVIALSSFFVISACKKPDNINSKGGKIDSVQALQPEKLEVDSVKADDSIKIGNLLHVKYTAKMLVFPGIKDQKLLDSIYFQNKGIKDFSKKGVQILLETEKNNYFDSMRKESKDLLSDITSTEDWYTSFDMNLKSNTNGYMHIQYSGSSYEGGAHDNYGFSERVFDLKNKKKVELEDITSMPQPKIEAILMKNLNKIPSGTTDERGDVKNSEMLLVKIIPATDNFYFDDKNLYFHYSPYEIAAFAAGDIVIPISWQDLKGTLNTEFKERMKIK